MQFCSDGDQAEQQSIKKYQGDLLYRKHKYKEALAVYQESQHCLPPNNTVLARELLESMAMCLLKLEKFNDALVLTKQIMVSNFKCQVNGNLCQFSLKNLERLWRHN